MTTMLTDLAAVVDALRSNERFVVLTHENPDGDALGCANERRIGPDTDLLERARLVINVDHHHDNNRFGKINLIVADASSTAEIVRDLLEELGVALTPEIAEALYVGLVTDTGKFQYTNTSPKALRLAADLMEAGADVHGIFRRVYETVQFAKLKLLARV